MPFEKPNLVELVERARRAFRTELPGSDAWIWPNNLNVSAKVFGAMVHLNLQWLDYIALQRWVTTADGEFLDRHGQVYGMPRLAPAFARGLVDMTGTSGTAIPSGLTMSRADGLEYIVTEGGVVSGGGTVSLAVKALKPGSDYNALAGTPMSLTASFANLNSEGAVGAAGIGLGADEEADESYRARLLWRLRMPPHGGAAHDYVAWAREIGGVTRVFVDPLAGGPGTVNVYFLMDDLYEGGIPQGADVSAVQAYIDAVRPVTAIVQVLAPSPVEVTIEIENLSPDTTAVRDAIALELADMFRREARVSTASAPFTLYRSKVWQAIADATGEDHHTLNEPAEDVEYEAGELPVLGDIDFITGDP